MEVAERRVVGVVVLGPFKTAASHLEEGGGERGGGGNSLTLACPDPAHYVREPHADPVTLALCPVLGRLSHTARCSKPNDPLILHTHRTPNLPRPLPQIPHTHHTGTPAALPARLGGKRNKDHDS